MTWFWIGILVLICGVVGGYVYLAEYRTYGGALSPASADRDEEAMQTKERAR